MFMQWLLGLLNYCACSWINRKEHDCVRVGVLQQALGGRALTWYNNHVLKDRIRGTAIWTFTDIIIAMYDHFIHPQLSVDREAEYKAVVYHHTKTEGIMEYYQSLCNKRDELVQPPSEVDFVKRFFNGLPLNMRHYIAERGIDPLYYNAPTILQVGFQYERLNTILQQLKVREVEVRRSYAGSSRYTPVKQSEG